MRIYPNVREIMKLGLHDKPSIFSSTSISDYIIDRQRSILIAFIEEKKRSIAFNRCAYRYTCKRVIPYEICFS